MAANKGHRWRCRLPTGPDDIDDDIETWAQDPPPRSRPRPERREQRRRDARREEDWGEGR